MRHLLIASFVVSLSLSVGAACATPTRALLQLDVGMTEEQVLEEFGRPDAVRVGGLRTQAQQPVGGIGSGSLERWFDYILIEP